MVRFGLVPALFLLLCRQHKRQLRPSPNLASMRSKFSGNLLMIKINSRLLFVGGLCLGLANWRPPVWVKGLRLVIQEAELSCCPQQQSSRVSVHPTRSRSYDWQLSVSVVSLAGPGQDATSCTKTSALSIFLNLKVD